MKQGVIFKVSLSVCLVALTTTTKFTKDIEKNLRNVMSHTNIIRIADRKET